MKFSKDDDARFIQIYKHFCEGLSQLSPEFLEGLDQQSVHVTHQRIRYMLDAKSQQKALTR
jgi:hypothetical protein